MVFFKKKKEKEKKNPNPNLLSERGIEIMQLLKLKVLNTTFFYFVVILTFYPFTSYIFQIFY